MSKVEACAKVSSYSLFYAKEKGRLGWAALSISVKLKMD
jgi:hypothetical protein